MTPKITSKTEPVNYGKEQHMWDHLMNLLEEILKRNAVHLKLVKSKVWGIIYKVNQYGMNRVQRNVKIKKVNGKSQAVHKER